MNFWKEHLELRLVLMLATFAGGIFLLIFGWRMTGQLVGLGLMLLGIVLLLACLYLYNARFTEPRRKRQR